MNKLNFVVVEERKNYVRNQLHEMNSEDDDDDNDVEHNEYGTHCIEK